MRNEYFIVVWNLFVQRIYFSALHIRFISIVDTWPVDYTVVFIEMNIHVHFISIMDYTSTVQVQSKLYQDELEAHALNNLLVVWTSIMNWRDEKESQRRAGISIGEEEWDCGRWDDRHAWLSVLLWRLRLSCGSAETIRGLFFVARVKWFAEYSHIIYSIDASVLRAII